MPGHLLSVIDASYLAFNAHHPASATALIQAAARSGVRTFDAAASRAVVVPDTEEMIRRSS